MPFPSYLPAGLVNGPAFSLSLACSFASDFEMDLQFSLIASLFVLIFVFSLQGIEAERTTNDNTRPSGRVTGPAKTAKRSVESQMRYANRLPLSKPSVRDIENTVWDEKLSGETVADGDGKNNFKPSANAGLGSFVDPDADQPPPLERTKRSLRKRIPTSRQEQNVTQPRETFSHTAVHPSTRVRPPKDGHGAISVQKEEDKLRNASVKLVMWLRNRLRKRLGDVAELEGDMQAEKILLQNLNESIVETTTAREYQIRVKLKTQKKLSEFENDKEEPERQLLAVQDSTKKLSDQLADLGENYNFLAERRRELQRMLHEAGFAHWLDMRGVEYLPATAVGVLAKSTELFQPLYRDFQEAVLLDRRLASAVEGVIPKLSKRSLIGSVIEEFLMLLPTIPLLMAWGIACKKLYGLSILHAVMYEAIGFMVEFCILFMSSVLFGREIIGLLGENKFSKFVSAGLFINVVMYVGYMFSQILVTVLQGSRYEMLQSILSVAVGYHYYRMVFRPVMLNESVKVSAVGHALSIFVFGLIAYEKKKTLQLQLPFEDELNEILICVKDWGWETLEAMKDIFREANPQMGSVPETRFVPSIRTSMSKDTRHLAPRASMSKDTRHPAPQAYVSKDTRHPAPRASVPEDTRHPALRASVPKDTEHPALRASVPKDTRHPALRSFPIASDHLGADQTTPRQGYGRWTGARVPSGFRHHNAAPPERYFPQHAHIARSGSRHRTPFTRSESNNSTIYGSCGE